MNSDKPFNKVEGLFSTRRKIDKEIEKIQKKCKHPSKSRWVCDSCSQIIGIPNDNEMKNYLKQ